MASQVIVLPSRLIDRILDHPETPRMIAFGSRDLVSTPRKLADGSRALCIDIDGLVHCPELSNRLSEEVFAILLTSTASGFPVPESLRDALVLHVLNDVEAALMEFRRLGVVMKILFTRSVESQSSFRKIQRGCGSIRRPKRKWTASWPGLSAPRPKEEKSTRCWTP